MALERERTKLGELQAELRKLALQASHIQMGGNVDDDDVDVGDLSLGEDSGEDVGAAILFLLLPLTMPSKPT